MGLARHVARRPYFGHRGQNIIFWGSFYIEDPRQTIFIGVRVDTVSAAKFANKRRPGEDSYQYTWCYLVYSRFSFTQGPDHPPLRIAIFLIFVSSACFFLMFFLLFSER